jgi:Ca-activated chloride channel family protein
MSTALPDAAAMMGGDLDLRFPDRRGLRTVVEGLIRLAEPPAENTSYQLDGEVVRDDELFDSFRYRYQATAGEQVPLVFERPLRPGRYRLLVRLHDVVAKRYFREELELDVPAVSRPRPRIVTASRPQPGPPPTHPTNPEATNPEAGDREATSRGPALVRAADGGPLADETPDPSVALRVPTDRLLLGKLRVEAETRGQEVAEVAFALDGRQLLRKRREPFGVELDLGRSPRVHRLAAVAYDAQGVELASDEVMINGGPHRFAVRLLEPRTIPAGAELVTARAEIDVPEDERLDRVEFHVNDRHYATLYQPPYQQPLPLDGAAGPAWIRVVAVLENGATAEQVRMVGGELGDEIDIDFVELHASVLDRLSRPVYDLAADEIEVYEDGVRQQLKRCELLRELPIHAGVLLDTSGSMADQLEEAEEAALQFFSSVLTERDRGTVITFAERPLLAARFTDKVEILASGLAGLEPTGITRLWDSVAYALHYFSGIRGKRALILITDGADSHSEIAYDEVLEYARRTGVALYVIGFNVPQRPPETGLRLDRLARETGGRSWRVARAYELEEIYRSIETELRSQYLIAYQSTNAGGSFREIDVRVARRGFEARALRGYYP